MTILLTDYWASQNSFAGLWLHPDDVDIMKGYPGIRNTFNFDYPAVPFNGDPAAPVVLLLANGGWDDVDTHQEFALEGAAQEHLERLRNPKDADWNSLCAYYQKRNYFNLLRTGKLVAVNLCGYRSQKVASCIGRLPSSKVHQKWLLEEVMPEVKARKKFLVAHRFGKWLPAGSQIRSEVEPWLDGTHGILSKAPISPDQSHESLASIHHFLDSL